jgi:hypothetical protein
LKRISIAILSLGLLVSANAVAENVFRWTDDAGEVHYGRTLPPEYANRPYEILNSYGVVIERVDDPLGILEPEPEEEEAGDELEPLFTPNEVRVRSDNLLMLRYYTEQELVDTMETEVAQLDYDIRLIRQSQASAISSLAGHVKKAADRQRAGMPEDEITRKNIHSLRQRLRKTERSLATYEQREAEIRASFLKDLERYRFLKNGGAPGTFGIDQDG